MTGRMGEENEARREKRWMGGVARASVGAAVALLLAFPAAGRPQTSTGQASTTTAGSVPTGTRFLVRLDDKLSTRKDKNGKKFKAKTLEPLETPNGIVVPPGAEIRGHVSRIEPAVLTGRARIWLSFDEIRTREGKLPIVAHVLSVPEEHSVKAGESREGEIEARTNKGKEEIEAAAAGAAIGAVVGATAKGGKGAGVGAMIGAAGGFLVASGMGQELELQKGTKLELELSRPLYVARK
jgi:hypothetical protein